MSTHKTKPKTPELLVRRETIALRYDGREWKDSKAWMLSCLIHTLIFVGIALIWSQGTHGTQSEADRPAGIAIAHITTTGTEYLLAGGSSSSSKSNSEAKNDLAATSIETPGAMSLEKILESISPSDTSDLGKSTGSDATGSGLTGTGTTGVGSTGTGVGKGLNQSKVPFMGTVGIGSSFVYVLDRSDSMNLQLGAPLQLAKKELMESLDSLEEFNQFQIVFYNNAPSPLAGVNSARNRLLFAKETEIRRAKQFIRSMIAGGGTEHIAALKLGLSYSPDVLFFMTDADEPRLSEAELVDLQERAARGNTTIHTIQFHPGKTDSDGGWIRILAEMNRGTYRFVDTETVASE